MKKIIFSILILSLSSISYSQNSKNSKSRISKTTTKAIKTEEAEVEEATTKAKTISKTASKSANSSASKFKTTSIDKQNKLSATKAKPSMNSDLSKFFTQLELGAHPSLKGAEDFLSIYTAFGLNFNLSQIFYVGPFVSTIVATPNSSASYTIEDQTNRTIDLASFRQTALGLTLGLQLTQPSNSIQVAPEVRAGYTFVNFQDVGFNLDNKEFIDYQLIGLNPRLNLGIRLSDYTSLGVVGGYHLPFFQKGNKSNLYEAQYPHGALTFRFRIPTF